MLDHLYPNQRGADLTESRPSHPDPLPVDVTLSKIIVAYPWIECGTCAFIWPRDSSHDPKHNRQCPSCDSLNVRGFDAFNAARMRGAYEWLEAKVIDTARRERARTPPTQDRQSATAEIPSRGGGSRGDLPEASPRHGDAVDVETSEAGPEGPVTDI